MDAIDTEPVTTATTDAGASPEVTTAASEPTSGTTPSLNGSPTGETQTAPAVNTGSLPTDTRTSTTPAQADPTATVSGANAAAAQADPYEKRWKDATAWGTKLSQENKRFQEQLKSWEGLDPNQVRQALQLQQQQAEAARLKPWHNRHPEFATTQARLARVRNYSQAAEAIEADPNVTPEVKQAMLARIARSTGVTREDAKLFQDFEADKVAIQERMATDFEGLFDDLFEARFQARMQQYEQFQDARTKTQSLLGENSALIEKRRDEILWAMQNPQRSEVAFALAKANEEIERLKARVGQDSEQVETAQAQSAALKARASVKRDAQTRTPAVDPVQEANKLGLSGSALAEYLLSHRQS